MKRKDITTLIERMEAFESRLNVRFEALSAFEVKEEYDDDHDIVVRGEVHATTGMQISEDIDIQLSIYDSTGRIIQTASNYIDNDKFYGFHTFEISCSVPPKALAKLRLYPKTS